MKPIHHETMNAMSGPGHLARANTPVVGGNSCSHQSHPQTAPLTDIAEPDTPSVQPDLNNLSVLLVEDNRANQMLATQLLEGEGAIVMLAENGEQALALLKDTDKHFDVVLMDIQMPVMNGYQATRAIRQLPRLSQLPIVAMSANALQSDREKALAAGMNDYIGKPFELDFLVGKLIQLCHLGQLTSASAPALSQQQDHPGAAATGGNQLLDFDASLQRFSGNLDVYQQVLRVFIEDAQRLVATLPECLNDCSRDNIMYCLHSVKGMAANLGAEVLVEICKKMEFTLSQVALCEQASYQRDLAQLQGGLLATCELIEQQLTDMATTAKKRPGFLKNSDLPTLLRQLANLLAHSDLAALGLQQRLHDSFFNIKPELFQLLDQNTKQMNFVEAEQICYKINLSLQC